MPSFLLSLLLLLSFHASLAQVPVHPETAPVAIRGTIVDGAGQTPLSYVTVAVLETGAHQPIRNIFTQENGTFRITGLPNRNYRLVLTYVGYQTKTIEVPAFAGPELNLGIIMLYPSTIELQEVQVQTDRLVVEQDVNKLTYHVDADPEQHILSALEMMRKVPQLSVGGDDNLQLNGSDSYLVLINGKTSVLFAQNPSDVFRSIPASAIKSIEVISNPPARYDAEGVGGVINITTHRKIISGYNGSVNMGLTSPKGTMLGGYLTARAGKMGFSGNFGSNTAYNPPSRSAFLREDLVRGTRLQQEGESNGQHDNQFLSGELSYELTPLRLLSASYRLNRSEGENDFSQEVVLSDAGGTSTQAYRNLSSSRQGRWNSDMGVDLQQSFKKNPDQLLTLSYQMSTSTSSNSSDFALQPLLNYMEQISQTQNQGSTREHNLQVDYMHPIGKQLLELGLKSNLRRISSDYFYQNKDAETGLFVLDPRLSNQFDYRQDIHAAYTSLQLQKNNWGLRLGARLEETYVLANFRSSETSARQPYQNIIPNLNLSHKLGANSSIRASYTQRLERPALHHLNPYVNQIDPRNISYGNEELAPALTHTFGIAYNTYKGGTSLNAGLTHHFTNNSIQYLTTLGEDTVARSTYANIGRRQTYGFTLSGHTTLFKKLNLSFNSTTQHVDITSTWQGRPQRNTGITLNASGNVSYRFHNTWRLTSNIGYSSPQVLLQGRSAGFVSNNFAVHKELLKKNKASASISVRNPFQKYRRFRNEVNDPAFHQIHESFSVIRQYNVSFNYRLGKVHAGVPRKKRLSQELE